MSELVSNIAHILYIARSFFHLDITSSDLALHCLSFCPNSCFECSRFSLALPPKSDPFTKYERSNPYLHSLHCLPAKHSFEYKGVKGSEYVLVLHCPVQTIGLKKRSAIFVLHCPHRDHNTTEKSSVLVLLFQTPYSELVFSLALLFAGSSYEHQGLLF